MELTLSHVHLHPYIYLCRSNRFVSIILQIELTGFANVSNSNTAIVQRRLPCLFVFVLCVILEVFCLHRVQNHHLQLTVTRISHFIYLFFPASLKLIRQRNMIFCQCFFYNNNRKLCVFFSDYLLYQILPCA